MTLSRFEYTVFDLSGLLHYQCIWWSDFASKKLKKLSLIYFPGLAYEVPIGPILKDFIPAYKNLYHLIFYCTLFYCIVFNCILLYLCCVALRCVVLRCVALCRVVACCVALYCVVLRYVVPCRVVLRCVVLCCVCTVLCCAVFVLYCIDSCKQVNKL